MFGVDQRMLDFYAEVGGHFESSSVVDLRSLLLTTDCPLCFYSAKPQELCSGNGVVSPAAKLFNATTDCSPMDVPLSFLQAFSSEIFAQVCQIMTLSYWYSLEAAPPCFPYMYSEFLDGPSQETVFAPFLQSSIATIGVMPHDVYESPGTVPAECSSQPARFSNASSSLPVQSEHDLSSSFAAVKTSVSSASERLSPQIPTTCGQMRHQDRSNRPALTSTTPSSQKCFSVKESEIANGSSSCSKKSNDDVLEERKTTMKAVPSESDVKTTSFCSKTAQRCYKSSLPEELPSLTKDRCNTSAVAIDNKIEQAMVSLDTLNTQLKEKSKSNASIESKVETSMDLVKSHLMYAVREEVEVLREVIKELAERLHLVEHENKVLRSDASPDTLAKLPPPQPPVQSPLLQQFLLSSSFPVVASSSSSSSVQPPSSSSSSSANT
ncbi:hypothetical protein ACOMHN_047172 [Nucella lapillus]